MKEQDIMTYDEAHYLDIGTNELPDIELAAVMTQFDENSNPTEKEKQYTTNKSKTVTVTGFNNEFPITADLIKNNKVSEHLYNIFRNRKVGKEAQLDHYIVELWKPVSEKANTFEARKIRQTASITGKVAAPGEQINYNGALKGGDFIDGEFNTSTKTFEPKVIAAASLKK